MYSSKLVQICEPSVSNLNYVLGNFKGRCETIGQGLKIPEPRLRPILRMNVYENCQQLSEIFECWLQNSSEKDRNWLTIVHALEDVNQKKLAKKVYQYTHFDPETEFQKPHWLMQNFKEKCEEIKHSHSARIVEDLDHSLASSHWYEIGCLLRLNKSNILDEIAKTSPCNSSRLMKMITELVKKRCTWRDLIFVLKEVGLAWAADKVEKFVEELGIPKAHIEFEPELKRADFAPDDPQEDILQAMCELLNLSPNETIIGNLYKHICAKKLTDDKVRALCGLFTNFVQAIIEHAGDIKLTIKECMEDMQTLKRLEKKFIKTRTRLKDKNKDLLNEKDRIIKEMKAKHCADATNIKQLEQDLKEVTDDINKVCQELKVCEQKLETVKKDYAKIKRNLDKCRADLNNCKDKLAKIQSDANEWQNDNRVMLYIGGGTAIGIIGGLTVGAASRTLLVAGCVGAAAGALIGGGPGAIVGYYAGAGIAYFVSSRKKRTIKDDLIVITKCTTQSIEDASKTINEISKIISDEFAND